MAMAISTAVPTVTSPFTFADVPLRSHRPTNPNGRHKRRPGTIAHQVCHQGLRLVVAARCEPGQAGGTVGGVGTPVRACPVQLFPSQ
jgi:hypothetical protein